jgi:iron complex transport system substrate-binding protein
MATTPLDRTVGKALVPALWILLLWIGQGCEGNGAERQEAGSKAPGSESGGSGREIPSRIVSLVPSTTQILLALGAKNLLVGRTDYDTAYVVSHLPSVGGGLQPSMETLVFLEPDLVIRFAGGSDRTTPARLDDLGIAHLAVRPDRIADVRALTLELGNLTGREAKAASLIDGMDATLTEIRTRIQGRRPVKVAYVLGDHPPWVAGPDTFMHELLVAAGGENVFSDLTALYGPVSPEEFLVREIDLILTPEGGAVVLPTSQIPVVRVSPSFEIPGPDLALSAWELATIMHPEVF